MDTTEEGGYSTVSPSPATSLSSLSWASSTSTESHTWQPLCLFRFLRPSPNARSPLECRPVGMASERGAAARTRENFTKSRPENLDCRHFLPQQHQHQTKVLYATERENLGSSAPELSEVLRTIQEAWPTQRSRSSVSNREPHGDQDRPLQRSCGCREEEGELEEEEEEEEDEEEEDTSEGDMGSSCKSGKAAEEGEARTGTSTRQSFIHSQLPRRRYSVPEVVIRKFRLAAEERWGKTPPAPFPPPSPAKKDEDRPEKKTWRGDVEETNAKVTYQNRGSQAGGNFGYLGSPSRFESDGSAPISASAPAQEVLSLIPRYSAIPRSDSMSVNLGGEGSAGDAANVRKDIRGGESEECPSLVDSLEDEAVIAARRNAGSRGAVSTSGASIPTVSARPQAPIVGGEAFFVAIGSSSPATSLSFSGSSPSPCSSEKHKTSVINIKKPSLSVGPETVSTMPKRLRDRLAQRHRRLQQKMERQRNQRKKIEEAAATKKTVPKPPRSRTLSKSPLKPAISQSKPSQPQRRLPLGHVNRENTIQTRGRVTKAHGASGTTPGSRDGTSLRPRGSTFKQKFKCIPEDRSLHLGSSSSSTPPSSLSPSSNSDEEEVEIDVISVEDGSETDAARLRPRLRIENSKRLGGRNRTKSFGGRGSILKQPKAIEGITPDLQTIKEESKASVEVENEGNKTPVDEDKVEGEKSESSPSKQKNGKQKHIVLNDTNNNESLNENLQSKKGDVISEPVDLKIEEKIEEQEEKELDDPPQNRSGSDENGKSLKRNFRADSLKRQKTTEMVNLLSDQISHKGKVALGIENNNDEDLVSLSCGWLNFYLLHTDGKSSFEEEEAKGTKKEEKVKELRKEKEKKPQKIIPRTQLQSRQVTQPNPSHTVADTNGNGFPTKLPQIPNPEKSPTSESNNLSTLNQQRSRLPRPLQTNRAQNMQNSLVPITSQPTLARPTQLSLLPNPTRIASDSSQAPHSSSPTSPSTSHQNDRSRNRQHRRRKGRDIDWGTEASRGTQTSDNGHGWSVTIAGSCPQPDVEMRLTFPAPQGRNRCSESRGRHHQSDSGLGEENGMGRDRRGQTAGPSTQNRAPYFPSSVPPQEPPETWLLTLRNESTQPGGALEEDISQPHSRLKPLKCLPEISFQPPNQNAGTKNKINKVTVRANRASSLRLKSAQPGFVPSFLENNNTDPTVLEEEDSKKGVSLFWPKIRRAIEQRRQERRDRARLCHEYNAVAMMLRSKEVATKGDKGGSKLEIHGSALKSTDNPREIEKTKESWERNSKATTTGWKWKNP